MRKKKIVIDLALGVLFLLANLIPYILVLGLFAWMSAEFLILSFW